MNALLEILSPSFLLRDALLGSLLVGLVCPLVGVYFVLRRMIFLGVALPQISSAGIAFSFLSGSGFPLIALTVAILVVVVAFWVRATDGGRLAAAGFALILGGAIGNLIDRVRLGSVVDFLLLHFGDRTLFVFNLADAALTLGPLLLIVIYLNPAKQ